MKKIYLTLIIAFLFTNFTFGQTLMSDEDHRMMMNEYATNLNTVLTAEMPQGITIDQFKKKVVNGELALSTTAQASILTFAAPLKTYGGDFATAKGLTATTDAYKYFYSSFSPSTLVQNGKLVENTEIAGLNATEMWTCALESFNTDNCGLSALVSDKSNLNTLTNTYVNRLTQNNTGNMGVLVMMNGFSDCISTISLANDLKVINSFLDKNQLLTDANFEALSLASETEFIPLMQDLGFEDVQLFEDILPKTAYNTAKFLETANYEKSTYNLSTIEDTPIFEVLRKQLGSVFLNESNSRKNNNCNKIGLQTYTFNEQQSNCNMNINVKGIYGGRKYGIVTIKQGYAIYDSKIGGAPITCGCGKNGGSWDWFWEL